MLTTSARTFADAAAPHRLESQVSNWSGEKATIGDHVVSDHSGFGFSLDRSPVDLVVAGRRLRIPRNWITEASVSNGDMRLGLHATYPELDGVTVDNIGLFKGPPHETVVGRRKYALDVRRYSMEGHSVRPGAWAGAPVSEEEARSAFRVPNDRTIWFDADGVAVTALTEHGGVYAWSFRIQVARGVVFSCIFGTPLFSAWRDLHKGLTPILSSFLVVETGEPDVKSRWWPIPNS